MPSQIAIYGWLLFFFVSYQSIHAQQQVQPTAITVEDGLGFRDVNAIAQDSEGFLWLGTDKGLDRYDGYRFLHFSKEQSADFYFPAEKIFDDGLLVLNDSTLWIIGNMKLHSLNLRTYAYRLLDEVPGDIVQMRAGKHEQVWFGTANEGTHQLWLFEPTRGFRLINSIPEPRREFMHLKVDTSGNAWWSTIQQGLRCINEKGEILHQKILSSIVWFGTKMHDLRFNIDQQNRIYICPRGKNQIWQYFPEQDSTVVVVDSLPSAAYCAYTDNQGNSWFGTKRTVVKITKDGVVKKLDESLQRLLGYSIVVTFFQDASDVIWIGTNGGLLRLPQLRSEFDTYLYDPTRTIGNQMRGICEGRANELYVFCESGERGLHHINLATGQQQRIDLPLDSAKASELLDQTSQLFYDDRYHCLWAFTTHLQRIDLQPKVGITSIPYPPGVTYPHGFKILYQLPDKRLLMGLSLGSLRFYDPPADAWTDLPLRLSPSLAGATVRSLMTQGTDSLWIGTTDKGLFLINSVTGDSLAHYHTQSTPALGSDHILSLYVDEDRDWAWVGTYGGGLYRLSTADGTLVNYNEPDGLPDNKIVCILPSPGRLWLGTYYGLASFDYSTSTFRNFFVEDGLTHPEFNYASFDLGTNGTIYAGGLNGVNAFHPDDLIKERLSLPLQLVNFQKFDHNDDSLYHFNWQIQAPDTPLVIGPTVSYFQFEWTLPDYVRPDQNQYFTYLEGVDKDWVFHGKQAAIRFNGLSPGFYRLRIKGRDNQGNWSERELSIPFWVQAPFWQRWYTIFLLIVALVGGVYGITRYQFRQRLRMEQIRTRIASDLHDEVGSMLSGLALQAEILEFQAQAPAKTDLRYLTDVSRSAVGKMRDLVWSIDSRRDYFHHLLDRMRNQAEEALARVNISYQFQSEGLPLEDKLPVDTRQHLYLIFREAITNICKHSNATQVQIFFGKKDGSLELRIHDNGTDIPAQLGRTGLGLDNLERRAQALRGTLDIKTEDGFLVLLKVPF